MKTRKIIAFLLLSVMAIACRLKQDQVTKIRENNVDVIINHLEPYHLKGEPGRLKLEKIFIITLVQNKF